MKSAETIKLIIENKLCPTHDVHPVVETIGNELEIACCCEEFHKECNQQAIGLFMMRSTFPYWVLV